MSSSVNPGIFFLIRFYAVKDIISCQIHFLVSVIVFLRQIGSYTLCVSVSCPCTKLCTSFNFDNSEKNTALYPGPTYLVLLKPYAPKI